jgi:hypothetical protein
VCVSLALAVSPLPLKVAVRSVSVTRESSHILVGLQDGKLIVVGAGKPEEVTSASLMHAVPEQLAPDLLSHLEIMLDDNKIIFS